jgi:predicted transcriptional regulator
MNPSNQSQDQLEQMDLVSLADGFTISRTLYNELSPEQLNSLMMGIVDAQNGRLIPHEDVIASFNYGLQSNSLDRSRT